MKLAAFDIEIASQLPEFTSDWLSHEPLGISCAAVAKSPADAIHLWQFTNAINEQFTKEQRISLIESIWKVIYTDDTLDKHEDYLVHKLQNLLRLSHKELIDAKLRVKASLG